MTQSLIEGGFGMWPVLAVGLVALLTGARYAATGDGSARGALEALVGAILAMAFAGFFAGLVATGSYITGLPEEAAVARVAITGAKEASNNLVLGFTLVGLVQLQLALGRRREDARA
jgi:hypothetical protein